MSALSCLFCISNKYIFVQKDLSHGKACGHKVVSMGTPIALI